jgi:hypothetical protein
MGACPALSFGGNEHCGDGKPPPYAFLKLLPDDPSPVPRQLVKTPVADQPLPWGEGYEPAVRGYSRECFGWCNRKVSAAAAKYPRLIKPNAT